MNLAEFEDAWRTAMDKLTPQETEMVETAISGSEVNHSSVYMLACFLLGALAGMAVP